MIALILGFGFVAAAELPRILRRRSLREAAAFLILYFAALALGIVEAMDREPPSTMILLGDLLKAVGLYYPA